MIGGREGEEERDAATTTTATSYPVPDKARRVEAS